MTHTLDEIERLNTELNDPARREEYLARYATYTPGLLPRVAGAFLVLSGNLVYGKKPSYLKFRAIEVIARVPYQSWTSAVYTLLTLFYTDESKALVLSEASRYARFAQDNETMHVVVISRLSATEGHAGFIRYTLIPALFAFVYFWFSYILYLFRPRWSYELNYVFEQHAFEQYSEFLSTYEEQLKAKQVNSRFLEWYGRHPAQQYDFFASVRNDELIHRNISLESIAAAEKETGIPTLTRIVIVFAVVWLVLWAVNRVLWV